MRRRTRLPQRVQSGTPSAAQSSDLTLLCSSNSGLSSMAIPERAASGAAVIRANCYGRCERNRDRPSAARSLLPDASRGRCAAPRRASAGCIPSSRAAANSARSIMAEAMSWGEFAKPGAPLLDFVLLSAIARRARRVRCGEVSRSLRIGAFPVAAKGSPAGIALVFKDVNPDAASMHRRHFTALPLRSLDQISPQSKLREIGCLPDTLAKAGAPNPCLRLHSGPFRSAWGQSPTRSVPAPGTTPIDNSSPR